MTPFDPTPPVDEELGALLRDRSVPAASPDFWAELDTQLAADTPETADRGSADETSVEIIPIGPAGRDELAERRNRKRVTTFMTVAAALALLVGTFAIFRTISESSLAPTNIAVQPAVVATPENLAPATQTPATEAPATQLPATELPATQLPATEAPATQLPAVRLTDGAALTDGIGGFLQSEDGALVHRRADGSVTTLVQQWDDPGETNSVLVQHWLTDVVTLAGAPHAIVRQFRNDFGDPAATDFQSAILAFNLVTAEKIEVERLFVTDTASLNWMYSGHITSNNGVDLLVERQLWQGECVWAEKLSFPSGELVPWPDSPAPPPAFDTLPAEQLAASFESSDFLQPRELEGCRPMGSFDGLSLGSQADQSTIAQLGRELLPDLSGW